MKTAIKETVSIDKLKASAKEWRVDNYHRFYFNDLHTLIGLQCERYKSGSLKSCVLDGEHISNSKARKLIDSLDRAKVWYDLQDQSFHGHLDSHIAHHYDTIVAKLTVMVTE